MVGVTESILIDHSADDLFAFVANYENDPIWRSGVYEMTHNPPGEAFVGMKTCEVMRFMGRVTVNDAEVVEYEPGQKTAFKTTAGPLTAWGYRLVAREGKQARITYHAAAELNGFFNLLSPLIVWMFRRRLKADLVRLQQVLERDASEVISQ